MVRAFELSVVAALCGALSGCFILFHDGSGGGGAGGNDGKGGQGATSASSPASDGITASDSSTVGVGSNGTASATAGVGTATAASTSTGATDCVLAGGQCAPAAPPGWTGPSVLKSGATCDPGTTRVLEGGASATAAQQQCQCSSTATCQLSGIKLDSAPTGDCMGVTSVTSPTLSNDVCQALLLGFLPKDFDVTQTPMVGSCDPIPAQTVPDTQYNQTAALCSFPTASTCPPPDECAPQGTVCVFHVGSVACEAPYNTSPPSPLAVATLSCLCPLPSGQCNGSVTAFQGTGCTGVMNTFDATNPNCDSFTGGTTSIGLKYHSTAAAPTCGSGTWHANTPQAYTLCCL